MAHLRAGAGQAHRTPDDLAALSPEEHLHAFTLASRRVIPRLTDTFRVVTYDLRGHGASSRSSDDSWAGQAGDLRALSGGPTHAGA